MAIIMVMGAFNLSAVVSFAATAEADAVIRIEETFGKVNETVSVDISIENNPGIIGMTLKLEYNESLLTLTEIKNGDALGYMTFTAPKVLKSGCTLPWDAESVSDEDIKDGTIATLVFKIAENAELDSIADISVSYETGAIIDKDMKPLNVETVDGRIQVIDYLPGDVNNDGYVNSTDVVYLRRYIADAEGYGVTIVERAADVNRDRAINTTDVVAIRRYIAGGYGIVLSPSFVPCNHNKLPKTTAKAATCTENGNIAYWYCSGCDKCFSDAEGKIEIRKELTVIPKFGHKVVVDAAVAPTHNSTGLTEGSHCETCNEVLVAQQEIPKLSENHYSITYRNLNGAEAPTPTSYAEHEGVFEMPIPVAPGYKFKGWYTASEGGTIVDYIPAGSKQNYILYARWDLETYNIRYFEAPQNDNVTTYTVEDEIYLNDPNWSGLGFTGWTEANGKLQTENRNGKIYYKIPEGTIGNLELTANWKLMRNIATPGTNTIMVSEYMEESGLYRFIYELGTIENVVIEELNSSTMGLYNHTGAGDFTLTMSTENTMEESIADSITKTISQSISSSSEWEESKEWAKEQSNEYSASASYGMEFGGDASPVKASIELGFGYTHSDGESWGGSETTGGSIGEETETGEEVGSCFTYLSSMTTTSEASVTISGDSPHGYYDYVQAGNIRVFGVVTYNPKDGNYYLNTYSILDNMHGIVLYYPDVNMLNNPTCETLEYRIPKNNIEETIAKSYYISYDANGGTGKANSSVHTVEGGQKLSPNTFTREGYVFIGWELRDENGLGIATYTDEQVITNKLAEAGKTVKLYAQWSPNNYTIEYQYQKPAGSSTQISSMPNTTSCVYDTTVTLGAAPVLSGYVFGGWYKDSGCTDEMRLGDGGEIVFMANFTNEPNGVIKAYPKWTAATYTLTFDLDGGKCSETSRQVTFDQIYNTLPTPTKSNAIFLGWTLNGVDVTDKTYVRTAGNHSLKAKWMSLTWTETRGSGDNKRFRMIDDRDTFWTEFAEDWNPGISKEILQKNGYTKVSIKLHFHLKELTQGNFRSYFATPGGKEILHWSFTDNPSGWTEYTRDTQNESTKYVDISNFGDNMEFKTIWEAYGNNYDAYDIGETTITLTFSKG